METILAESEIRSLLTKERYYRDVGEWEKLRDCYHPDSAETLIKVSWYTGEIDGFIAGSIKMFDRGQGANLIHNINVCEITINADRAVAVSVCQITTRNSFDGREVDTSSWIRIVTMLKKVNVGGSTKWKMLSLEPIYLRDNIMAVTPRELLNDSDRKILEEARQSYKCVSWDIIKHGGWPSFDMPGVDKPETVEEVLGRNYAWISTL